MLNTRRNELYNANEVVNSNDLRKRIVNVDTRFRTVLTEPASNCTFRFEHPYKNVIRMRVASVEIPNVWYEFSAANYHNTYFTICAYDISKNLQKTTITIPDGNYSAVDLCVTIQNLLISQFQIPYGIFITVFPDPINIKTTFINNGVGPPGSAAPTASASPFILNFKVPELCYQPFDFGLGSNLGFMSTFYNVTNVYDVSGAFTRYGQTSESLINIVTEPYVLLAIDEFKGIDQKTMTGYYQCLAKVIVRETKYLMIYDDGATLLSNEIIFPSPVDLAHVKIKLLDPYGNPLDLNYMNFSFSLEITEVMNTKMYEFYRNYIWMGSVPSLPSNVTGSGQGLLGGKGPLGGGMLPPLPPCSLENNHK